MSEKKSKTEKDSPKKDKKENRKDSPKGKKNKPKKIDRNGKITQKPKDVNFENVEVSGPETKTTKIKGKDFSYYSLDIVNHVDGEDAFLQVKFKNVQNVYWSRHEGDEEDKKKKKKSKDKKDVPKGPDYSCSIYKTKDKTMNAELIAFSEDLNKVLLKGMEEHKSDMGEKLGDMNFDPEQGRISDKWSGVFRKSKTGKEHLSAKPPFKGAKPNIQKATKEKNPDTGRRIRKKVDVDELINTRTTCDITLRFSHIYVSNDAIPQVKIYSVLLRKIEERDDVDKEHWDEEADEEDEKEIDELDAKLENIKNKGGEAPKKKEENNNARGPGKAKLDDVKDQVKQLKENVKKKGKESEDESEESGSESEKASEKSE